MSKSKITRKKLPPGRPAAAMSPRITKSKKRTSYSPPIDATRPFSSDELAQLAALGLEIQATSKLVVVSGAGIPVNAGIPDFRTMRKSSQGTLDISAYDSSEATGRFHTLIRNISRLSALAKPTNFHEFLDKLALRGHLLRHYTQNIDCIEGHLPELWAKTVQLRGRIDQAVCQSCKWTVPFLADSFRGPHLPDCQQCEEAALKRERLGKRHRGIGRLRPNVVLYGEENPDGDRIGKIAERDLRTGPDVVIVVGTGLKVPGARRLVKEFCHSTKSRRGPAVWINKDPVPSGLKGCFDSTLQRDCDDLVSLLSL